MKKYAVLFLIFFAWMTTPASAQTKTESEGIRPALLVIDIQNAFLPMIPQREKETGMYFINEYLNYFRSMGFPIIRVYHTDPQWGPNPDSAAFQFPESVPVLKSDGMVVKNYPDAFKKTNLESMLREKNCNTLFLCGLSSVGCVLATYFGAKNAEFNVFMLKGAVMSHNSVYTENIQEILNAVDFEVVDLLLKNAVKP